MGLNSRSTVVVPFPLVLSLSLSFLFPCPTLFLPYFTFVSQLSNRDLDSFEPLIWLVCSIRLLSVSRTPLVIADFPFSPSNSLVLFECPHDCSQPERDPTVIALLPSYFATPRLSVTMVSPSPAKQSKASLEKEQPSSQQQQRPVTNSSASSPSSQQSVKSASNDLKKTVPAPAPAVNVWQARKTAAAKPSNGNVVEKISDGAGGNGIIFWLSCGAIYCWLTCNIK